jgi:hypothetical protein
MQDGNMDFRKTGQYLVPDIKTPLSQGKYDIYPSLKLEEGKIEEGMASLAARLVQETTVVVDGYVGVFYEAFRNMLDEALKKQGKRPIWHEARGAMKSPEEVESMVLPFLGGSDPLFGTRTSLSLMDFFVEDQLKSIQPDSRADINILIGPGAALAGWEGLLLYIDLPKNELQFRSRAGRVSNLGAKGPGESKSAY